MVLLATAFCAGAKATAPSPLSQACRRPTTMSAAATPAGRVIVVGGGLAGHVAALTAAEAGADVLLLEKEPRTGGNSAKASSGISAVAEGDSAAAFAEDTLRSGGGRSDPRLVRKLTQDSQDAVEWLLRHGADLGGGLVQMGGHSRARTRRAKAPAVGFGLMQAMGAAAAAAPRVRVETGAAAAALLLEGGRVVGVHVRRAGDGAGRDERAGAVVLATGGFGANAALLAEHAPAVAGLPTTCGPWSTGDGLALAAAAGAALVDLDAVQIHPTAFHPKDYEGKSEILAPEALRGCGGLLIDERTGRRFVDELATRAVVAGAMLALPTREAFLLLGAGAQRRAGACLDFYKSKSLAEHARGLDAAAALIGDSSKIAAELREEVAAYNAAAAGARADRFGKTAFPDAPIDPEGEFLVARVAPAVHYTMGGAKIDADGAVLDAAARRVAGLFAAGEATGGVHGANRLGGNSLLDCAVFGRAAGAAAAAAARAPGDPRPARARRPSAKAATGYEAASDSDEGGAGAAGATRSDSGSDAEFDGEAGGSRRAWRPSAAAAPARPRGRPSAAALAAAQPRAAPAAPPLPPAEAAAAGGAADEGAGEAGAAAAEHAAAADAAPPPIFFMAHDASAGAPASPHIRSPLRPGMASQASLPPAPSLASAGSLPLRGSGSQPQFAPAQPQQQALAPGGGSGKAASPLELGAAPAAAGAPPPPSPQQAPAAAPLAEPPLQLFGAPAQPLAEPPLQLFGAPAQPLPEPAAAPPPPQQPEAPEFDFMSFLGETA
jgi:cleavage and polyadenylation specificity factor subunit 2/mediator of RNA polymerase II transcription subunit 4